MRADVAAHPLGETRQHRDDLTLYIQARIIILPRLGIINAVTDENNLGLLAISAVLACGAEQHFFAVGKALSGNGEARLCFI